MMRKLVLTILIISAYAGTIFSQSTKDQCKSIIDKAQELEHRNIDSAFLYVHQVLNITADTSSWCFSASRLTFGNLYWHKGELDSAVVQYELTKRSCELRYDTFLMSKAISNLGLLYANKGELDTAIVIFKQVVDIAKQVRDTATMSNTSQNIGLAYARKGQQDTALIFLFEALELAEASQDTNRMLLPLQNIGGTYRKMKEPEKALKYYTRLLALAKESNNKRFTARAENVLGLLQGDKEAWSEALPYFRKALVIYQELNASVGIRDAFGNIGYVYMQQNALDSAEQYYTRVIQLTDSVNMVKEWIITQRNLARIAIRKEQYNKAATMVQNAIVKANTARLKYELKECYKLLTECYTLMGLTDQAVNTFDSFVGLYDSMYTEVKTKKALELEVQYERAKDRAKTAEQALVITKQRNENIILYSAVLLLVIIGISFFIAILGEKRRRIEADKRRAVEAERNALLEEKVSEFETENQELKEYIKKQKSGDKAISPTEYYMKELHLTTPEKPSIALGNIIYFKRDEGVLLVHTLEKKYVVWHSLKKLQEDILLSPFFIQIHKSTVINLRHVKERSKKEIVMTNGISLEVAHRRRVDVKKLLDETLEKYPGLRTSTSL